MILITFLLYFTFCQSHEDGSKSPFHLQPLGSHIPATDVDSIETSSMLTPRSFMEKYVLPRKPVVFRGIGKEWGAFKAWTDKYLKETYPNLELRMEGRKEKQSQVPQGDVALGRDTMKHFINTYHDKEVNKYVVSDLPTPLYKYVKIPPPLGCGELTQRFTEINLWINSGGAKSILHKDSPNTINCVVNGTKSWKLVEFKYNEFIYQAWEGPQEAGYGGYSLINPEKVDLVKFPKITQIPRWYYTEINAGDCLYLPTQMWHVVHSFGEQNLAVAFLLSQFNRRNIEDIDFAECGDLVPENNWTLDKIDVDWQYSGFGNQSMGFSDLVDYLPEIRSFFSTKTKKLSKKLILRSLFERHNGATFQKEKSIERTKQIFEYMTKISPKEHGPTLSMVNDLTRDEIRVIGRLLEPHYPGGTLEHEYAHFQSSTLIEICENLAAENNGLLRKESFVNLYLEMNGSLKFAEEFWSNLVGGEGKEQEHRDVKEVLLSKVEANFEKATFKYRYYAAEEEDNEEENEEEGENRNEIPNSDYLSEPKGKKADFHDKEDVAKDGNKQPTTRKDDKTEL